MELFLFYSTCSLSVLCMECCVLSVLSSVLPTHFSLLYLHLALCPLCTNCIAYILQFTVTTLSVLCVLSITSFSNNADEWQMLLFTCYGDSIVGFTFIFHSTHAYNVYNPLAVHIRGATTHSMNAVLMPNNPNAHTGHAT